MILKINKIQWLHKVPACMPSPASFTISCKNFTKKECIPMLVLFMEILEVDASKWSILIMSLQAKTKVIATGLTVDSPTFALLSWILKHR